MAESVKDRVAAIRARIDSVSKDSGSPAIEMDSDEYIRAFSNQHNNWGGFRKGWGSRTIPDGVADCGE